MRGIAPRAYLAAVSRDLANISDDSAGCAGVVLLSVKRKSGTGGVRLVRDQVCT